LLQGGDKREKHKMMQLNRIRRNLYTRVEDISCMMMKFLKMTMTRVTRPPRELKLLM